MVNKKYSVCDACLHYQTIWSIMKPVILQSICYTTSCSDAQILRSGNFRQTKSIALSLAHAHVHAHGVVKEQLAKHIAFMPIKWKIMKIYALRFLTMHHLASDNLYQKIT